MNDVAESLPVCTGTVGLPSPPKSRRELLLRGEMVWKETGGAPALSCSTETDCHGGDESEKADDKSSVYICASLGAEL